MKSIAVALFAIILAILGLTIFLQLNDLASCDISDQPLSEGICSRADAIVAVSGGDTSARTQHAVDLYKNGWAPLLIFSGAALDKSGPSNAEAMRQSALDAGVPSEAILIEEYSENTNQNATNTKSVVEANDIKKVILVTSGYHQRRANLEFGSQLGSDVVIKNSPTQDSDWSWYWWLTPRGWWLAASEFVKVIAFYAGLSQ